MSQNSYTTIINALSQFAIAHESVKRYKVSFFSELNNFATGDDNFPVLYLVPTNTEFSNNVDTYSFNVYCIDILLKDRTNEQFILNDTLSVLRDLTNWLRESDDHDMNVIDATNAQPLNNFALDYTVGWNMSLTIQTPAITSECYIPFSGTPTIFTGNTCDFSTVSPFLTCDNLEFCQTIIDLQNQIDGIVVSADTFTVGGSYNNSTGTLSLLRNDGGTIPITGFTTGSTSGTDIYVTGGTLAGQTLTLRRNDNVSIAIPGFSTGGTITIGGEYLPLSGGTVSGATTFTSGVTSNQFNVNSFNTIAVANSLDSNTGLMWDGPDILSIHNGGRQSLLINASGAITNGANAISPGFQTELTGNTRLYSVTATTISATTYQNLPLDIRVTGGTYSNGTAIFTNNTGGTFNVTGFTTGSSSTDIYVTGGTFANGTTTLRRNDGNNVIITGYSSGNNNVIYGNGIDQSGTTAASNTLIGLVLISGGTYVAGDVIRMEMRGRKNGVSVIPTNRFYFNTSPTLAGATLIGTSTSAANLAATYMQRTLPIKVTNGTGNGTEAVFVAGTYTSDSTPLNNVSSMAINWENDVYLLIAGQMATSAETQTLSYITVKRI
jgi:hypothetical protein